MTLIGHSVVSQKLFTTCNVPCADDACTAKFRREFSWACRTGCSPAADGQQTTMPVSQWRTRDKMTDVVVGGASRRHHHHHLPFRFSDVMRRDNAAAEVDGLNPPADGIIA